MATTWNAWNYYDTTGTTDYNSTSTTSSAVWHNWNTDTTVTTTTNNTSTVWIRWVGKTYYHKSSDNVIYFKPKKKTWEEKQKELSNKRQSEINRVWREYIKGIAEDAATDLLMELIGEDQRKVYKETGRILIKGQKYDYLLSRDYGNKPKVQRVEKHKIIDLCVYPKFIEDVPYTDKVIALKLAIDSDEKKFNKIANNMTVKTKPKELPQAANG